jgi:aspartyl-tRNA synthetase
MKYRTHHCGELRLLHTGEQVILSGWAFRIRPFGGMIFIDLRDRFGVTQLVFDENEDKSLCDDAKSVGREFVIRAEGVVRERSNKNNDIPTGDIEILVTAFQIINGSEVPPFTLENETDGGDELRMKYRYLDLRREVVKKNILLRHQLAQEVRTYLNDQQFLEIETPFLIKSTPEGARDFIVPSRMNQGTFYALPQSPQTFKQLLMVAGFERYYQIVRCFRDEDLRADRQPEFTQIDCELSFVERDDVLNVFEGLVRHVFSALKNLELPEIARISYSEAMNKYGSDKPDLRFAMEINDITTLSQHRDFPVFNSAGYVCAICVSGGAGLSRKQIDSYTEYVKRPQLGAGGLAWVRYDSESGLKSSVDKFYNESDLKTWMKQCGGGVNDLLFILSGEKKKIQKVAGELRLKLADDLGFRNPDVFQVCWVVDFPLLEYDEDAKRYFAMHHPFTSPIKEDIEKLKSDPGSVRANAYDLVINGVEVGGGSIRISDRELQQTMFSVLGFTEEDAKQQFGFLLNAFRYGAPPHGGIAFGFDRFAALLGGSETIRDFIAFPKNNQGRDMMLDAPSPVSEEQLKELGITLSNEENRLK